MIKFCNYIFDKTIKYLNENYPVDEDVYLKPLEGYDCVEGPDGEKGFAVIDIRSRIIYVPVDMTLIDGNDITYDEEIICRIAHEYKHLLQWCEGEQFLEDDPNAEVLEDEAEEFATKIVKEMLEEEGENNNDNDNK